MNISLECKTERTKPLTPDLYPNKTKFLALGSNLVS